MAAGAGVEEGRQEVETSGTSAIGDGGSGEEGLPREGLHVLLVDVGSVLRVEVRLAGVVRLVGTVRESWVSGFLSRDTGSRFELDDLREEILASARDGRLGDGVPVAVLVGPKGWDEHEGVGYSDAVARGTCVAPVGSPVHVLTAGEEVRVGALRVVVVYEPTLGRAAGGDICWDSGC